MQSGCQTDWIHIMPDILFARLSADDARNQRIKWIKGL